MREIEHEVDLVVWRRDQAADGVVSLTLTAPSGAELPVWTPGAHIDLQLSPSLVRQYSLCGPMGDRRSWRIAVLLESAGRGGSQLVHDKLREGATVRVRGPRNHFELVDSPRYQFIAGGIGITPILAMARAAEERGADWNLLYGGRSRASMAFLAELEQYRSRVSVRPQDEDGLLDLAAVLSEPQQETLVYCCGPEGLLGAVESACLHWPDGSLHVERFAAKPVDESVGQASSGFDVECKRSGRTVAVPPDKSIFDALEEAGVEVIGSCLEGVCGTCESAVLDGQPDHRDSVLTDVEQARNDTMMICVSRCRSERLVLDL